MNKDIKVKIRFSNNDEKKCIENIENILAKMYSEAIIDRLKETTRSEEIDGTITEINNILKQKCN